MPAKNRDLHGNAPDTCEAALLLVDVINDLEFPEGRRLLAPALRAAKRIAALKERARATGIPVIYANDNFGRWRSDFAEVVQHCLHEDVTGRPIAELLAPEREDYFVLKPKHSAFFATVLETLLEYLRVKRLILAGYAGDACVLITAADAYLHDFELYVPRDCTASASAAENTQALRYMARVLHADTAPSTKLDLRALGGRRRRSRKIARSGG
ncbi:MAG TPA: isochorismatase family cysteine hydrolase [Burkholderiales bacterium]|nr:isochorismatase family cysteine hydrolase [Burkholderiales bacterium]